MVYIVKFSLNDEWKYRSKWGLREYVSVEITQFATELLRFNLRPDGICYHNITKSFLHTYTMYILRPK